MNLNPVAVFNELSLPSEPVGDNVVQDLVSSVSNVVLALRKIRKDVVLSSPGVSFPEWPLTVEGETFASLSSRHGGRTMEQWRLVQSALSKAPYLRAPRVPGSGPSRDSEDREAIAARHSYDGSPAIGLGVAALHEQVAVSLPTCRVWTDSTITLLQRATEHSATSTASEVVPIEVRHVSDPTHCQTHELHIREMSLPFSYGGSDLWAQRGQLFPGVDFLDRVKDDLVGIKPKDPSLLQIHSRLRELSDAACHWHITHGASPVWHSKVTPESAQRKKLCFFTNKNGAAQCYDLHARFTPGAGRVHFAVNRPESSPHITVAYIGSKLT